MVERRAANPEKYRKQKRDFYAAHPIYREDVKERIRKRRAKMPQWYLLDKARRRAKKAGLEFDLDESDIVIPDTCPVLGIPIQVLSKTRDNSATIDRRVPSLGYVSGNVAVISFRANSIKRDATLDELKALVRWLSSQKGYK